MKRLFLLLTLIIILSIGAVWALKPDLLSRAVDFTEPSVQLDGKGADFTVRFDDTDSGIASWKVTIEQGGKSWTILEDSPADPAQSVEVPFRINFRELGVAEGQATLKAIATDGALSGNKIEESRILTVDLSPPSIVILSQQHVAYQGGVEFVLFRVGGGSFSRAGVEIADSFFTAFPGKAFDERLEAYPDVYGTLFALPLDYSARTPIRVIVEDEGGNRAASTLEFPVRPTKTIEVRSKLSIPFLERRLPPLFQSYAARTKSVPPELGSNEAQLREQFVLINETYRALLRDELFTHFDKPEPKRHWDKSFVRPVPGSTTSLFGERRKYELHGQSAGGSLHEGLDLASVKNDVVRAVNHGKVAFSGEFGIYGETVIIDHGVGLFTIYGHLDSRAVESGAPVEKGQEIGRTGATGLAGGDHLHFEYRVGRMSVNPIEWWDDKWIRDNIDGKIEGFLSTSAS